jgi:two-component system NtrC family sensor kinase
VRLFTELQASNRELTTALDTQTATSDILRVISSSPTDVQPMFEAVAASAARLCDAFDAAIYRVDGDSVRLVAHEGPIAPDPILPLTEGTLGGRVTPERRAMHVDDMQAEAREYPVSSDSRELAGSGRSSACPCSAELRHTTDGELVRQLRRVRLAITHY